MLHKRSAISTGNIFDEIKKFKIAYFGNYSYYYNHTILFKLQQYSIKAIQHERQQHCLR